MHESKTQLRRTEMEVKKSVYRQRVYRAVDGTIELVFGNDPVSDETWVLLADHDICQVVTVTDHVEP